MKKSLITSLVLAVCGALLFVVPQASATTFCVPAFSAECPDSGGNVQQADLETAMKSNASDGVADKVIMPAYAYSNPTTLDVTGSDDLEVVGAGPGQTTITSSTVNNLYVVNLAGGRNVTLRGLKIIVPATMPDNAGAAMITNNDKLIDVEIESRNPGSLGVQAFGGGQFRGVDIHGASGGSFTRAIDAEGGIAGDLVIDRSTISGAATAVRGDNRLNPVTMTASRISPLGYGMQLAFGTDATVTNSVFERGTESPISITVNDQFDIDLDLASSTIVNTGDATKTAINAFVTGVDGNGSANVEVRDSILHGFATTWYLAAPANDPDVGNANLSIDHSDFAPNGQQPGDGTLTQGAGNINQDPGFTATGDYHLTAGSPAVDAAAPAGGPVTDLDGAPRPQDGNNDGTATGDMGAYEVQPATVPAEPTCETDPSLCPTPPPGEDRTAPRVSRIKFKAPGRKKGSLKLTLSEAASAAITFKPTPAGKGTKKRKTVKLTRNLDAGANVVKLRKGLLKRGRYRLSVVAADAAGNVSGAGVRKVRVKGRS